MKKRLHFSVLGLGLGLALACLGLTPEAAAQEVGDPLYDASFGGPSQGGDAPSSPGLYQETLEFSLPTTSVSSEAAGRRDLSAVSPVPAFSPLRPGNNTPIQITAEGETTYENGLATAEKNVVVYHGDTTIYADFIQYNPETKDLLAIGNVRIFKEGRLAKFDRVVYNLETKETRVASFRSLAAPFFTQGPMAYSLKKDSTIYESKDTLVTASDSSHPDSHLRASNVRIHPGDYITMRNVRYYLGDTPVFWFPYVYQSLKSDEGFNFVPGYSGDWGAYFLTRYGIPFSEETKGAVLVDLRSKRGLGLGFNLKSRFKTPWSSTASWAHLRSYYTHDSDPEYNSTAQNIFPVTPDRYRFSFQSRTFLTDNLYASADINKVSDYRFLRDFYASESRVNPKPANQLSLTQWDERYTITGVGRMQLNDYLDTTTRLPELALDVPRQPLLDLPVLGLPLFYEGETSAARLERRYGTMANTSSTNPRPVNKLLHNYDAERLDTFHQLTLPLAHGGWFSLIPRIGGRATWYSNDAVTELAALSRNSSLDLRPGARTLIQHNGNSDALRTVFNLGVESAVKFSREWEELQSRTWGLDGLRHVVQPYTDLSYVRTNKDPMGLLQFDRLTPSTELPAIDFPQFTAIDSIPNWTVWRFGVRNTLQTRRDDATVNLLEMDTFLNANLDAPNYPGLPPQGKVSNLNNRLRISPFNWLALQMDTQLPLEQVGFTQNNISAHFLATRDLSFTLGHRYLQNNPYFQNSSLAVVGAYYRLNENWGVSFTEQYEFNTRTLQWQNYGIHRDLSSWVASLNVTVQESYNGVNRRSVSEVAVLLTFTLKDLPSLRLPVSFRPYTEDTTNN